MANKTVEWMQEGKFGVMCHYISDDTAPVPLAQLTPEVWNAQVDQVDADALAEQVASTGAAWFIFTVGQNSGFYCTPNQTFDRIVGRSPSHLSERDLMADVAAAMASRGVRTIAYTPSHAPADDRVAVEALACTPDWDASLWQLRPGRYLRSTDTDKRLSTFQRNWESILREWSLRWGKAISGWWVDGCYYGDRMYHHDDEPNLESFAAAMKAGNPEAVVAFNPGVKLACYGPAEDYTAGEMMHDLFAAQWEGGYSLLKPNVGTSQTHILTHLGPNWCKGDRPRFNDRLTIGYTEHVASCGGGITWDVPINRAGQIPQTFIDTLIATGRAVGNI